MSLGTLHKVFVYGTLKRGEPNYHQFSKNDDGYFKFLYEAKTKEKYPLIIGTKYNIPFLLEKPGLGFNVQGEVFEVDDTVFKNLDILEDHPNFYVRDMYEVENSQTKAVEKVWIYMIKQFKEELLKMAFFKSYSNSGEHGFKYVESELELSSIDDLNIYD